MHHNTLFRFLAAAAAAATAALLLSSVSAPAQPQQPQAQSSPVSPLPDNIHIGDRKEGHVQGIAVDEAKGFIYLSFTTNFIKADLQGNIVGTISHIQGHLGAMTLGPDGRVYASLECKDDAIGRGIAASLGQENLGHDLCTFYVAIIDVDSIDREGMDPERDGVMTTVCIRDAVRDYRSGAFGCSGIDGITFAPPIGKKTARNQLLYIAYGIYGDTSRTDNDHQVILCYDTSCWKKKYEKGVVFGTLPTGGPEKPLRKYLVRTGNTEWGVQNMAYDRHTDRIYMAVYKGRKSGFPNYSLFAVDRAQKPFRAKAEGLEGRHSQLSLSDAGLRDPATGIRGWNFKWGSTGMCPMGDGRWYISHNGRDPVTGLQYCNARLHIWTGEDDGPFR